MVNSEVPQVVLNPDGSVELTVQVAGFAEGKSVEVYGYVTQNSGYFASFRENRTVPKSDGTGRARLTLLMSPEKIGSPEKMELKEDEPVTVVTWVSDVWPSILQTASPSVNGEFRAKWAIDEAASNQWRLSRSRGQVAQRHGTVQSGGRVRDCPSRPYHLAAAVPDIIHDGCRGGATAFRGASRSTLLRAVREALLQSR
jgi:hypothetical protein